MLKQFLRGPLNSKCKMCSISYTKISKQGEQVVTNIKSKKNISFLINNIDVGSP